MYRIRKSSLFYTCFLSFFLLCSISCKKNNKAGAPDAPLPEPLSPAQVALWLTNPDKSALFAKQNAEINFTPVSNQHLTIEVDTTQIFQTMDGFGFTLTGGSAYVINRMHAADRAALLQELFATDNKGIGVSYLRISIGASDLNGYVYTYDDLASGETDLEMLQFSLYHDKADLIPVLKEILDINPAIKILGSPWTAPEWMKTNNSYIGGSLKLQYYDAYARYFVKYIKAMKAEGIRIDAVTLQNEPLHPGNNPSMLMSATEQATFIKQSVGPAFEAANLDTKIIVYDHNAYRPDYPISILDDPEARKYVDGSGFHLYAGSIEALSQVHAAHPDKHIYFTEQWIGAPGNFSGDLSWHIKNLVIGATRNWSRNVLEWNLAADPKQQPHTAGGCDACLPAITVNDDGSIRRNPAYYIVAHASKFVRPGAVRIASSIPGALQNVAFKNPDGRKVLIVLNDGTTAQTFNIGYAGKTAAATLKAGAVGTYVW